MQLFIEPTFIRRSIFEIDYDLLWAWGVRVLLFDVDNTLTTQGIKCLDEPTRALLASLVARGFTVYLASNSRRNLVPMADSFGGKVHQPGSGIPRKPALGYFRPFLELPETSPTMICMVGDKLFFDAIPPRRLDMHSVLVNPLGGDLPLDRWFGLRRIERFVLASLGLVRP